MTRHLDETQDDEYARSGLRGDKWVDMDAGLPLRRLDSSSYTGAINGVRHRAAISLDGDWLVASCDPETEIQRLDLIDWHFRDAGSQGVGEGWFRLGYDRSDWMTLSVPGSVQAGLIDNGTLADPFWNTNTYDELTLYGEPQSVPWNLRKTRIEQSEWWFAKSFTVPRDLPGDALSLCFDGLDYAASVYLNGRSLGHHSGMFGGPDLDVTGLLRVDGPNELVVRLFPPPPNWYGILKGNPGWGWHYGHLISVGIWQSVRIEARPTVAQAHPFAWTRELSADSATVAIQFDIESRSVDTRQITAILTTTDTVGAVIHHAVDVDAPYGTSRWTTNITVGEPHLWWPLGYGEQPLYSLSITVQDAHSGEALAPASTTRFGIRTVDMVPATGAAAGDYRWQFVVNGVPLFIKGTNWCWTNPLLRPDQSPTALLELAADANIQMLRAWGGGIIESEEFYDRCDELGILVYQEFPFSWGPPDSPGTDLGVVDDQVSRVVKSLRNHPSLVMWGGGNENGEPYGADEGLFLVGRRCRQYDPTRPYHRSDPWGGSAHNYEVYHNGQPIDSGYLSMESVFYAEFGLPSMPHRASVERFLPAESLDHWPPTVDDLGIIAHLNQFTLLDLVKEMRYCHYGPVTTWDQYIEYSQFAQGDALRYAAERQRAGAGDGSKTGFWFYKLTELFPGHSWGILDYHGVPKDSYFRARQVCRARAVFATYDHFNWEDGDTFQAQVYAANDTPDRSDDATVTVELFDYSLQLIERRSFPVAGLDANETVLLGSFSTVVTAGREPALLAVRDSAGDGDHDSWYWFNFLPKTSRMHEIEALPLSAGALPETAYAEALHAYCVDGPAPLRELPRTTLEVSASTDTRTGIGTLIIANTGDLPAFNIAISSESGASHWSDNNFCLSARSTRQIAFRDPSAGEAALSITAWNADTVRHDVAYAPADASAVRPEEEE